MYINTHTQSQKRVTLCPLLYILCCTTWQNGLCYKTFGGRISKEANWLDHEKCLLTVARTSGGHQDPFLTALCINNHTAFPHLSGF